MPFVPNPDHPTPSLPISLPAVASCLKDAETRKEQEGGARCSRHGWGFVASAFSTWGMAGPSARYILGEVVRRATNGMTGWTAITHGMTVRQSVSLTLARGLALQLRAKNRVLDTLLMAD